MYFQCLAKREIDKETVEKNGQLEDEANSTLYEIKVEIDNAEEEIVCNGEYVYLPSYPQI